MSEVTLRLAAESDSRAVAVLAQRDCAEPPAGRLLLAEIGGAARAAVSLESGAVIADPFHPTADLVELLRRRAAQIRRAEAGGRGLPLLPRPRRRQPGSSTSPAISGTT